MVLTCTNTSIQWNAIVVAVLILLGADTTPENAHTQEPPKASFSHAELHPTLNIVGDLAAGIGADLHCIIGNSTSRPIVVPRSLTVSELLFFDARGNPVQSVGIFDASPQADFRASDLVVLQPGREMRICCSGTETLKAWDSKRRELNLVVRKLLLPDEYYCAYFLWHISAESVLLDTNGKSSARVKFPDATTSVQFTTNPIIFHIAK